MEMHDKKRVEIIVEAPALRQLRDRLDRAGAQGYTILPALAGKGHSGVWDRAGSITDAGRRVAVICIADATKADEIIEATYDLVHRHSGILAVSDVKVVRAEHF